jgi:hypothetical protein
MCIFKCGSIINGTHNSRVICKSVVMCLVITNALGEHVSAVTGCTAGWTCFHGDETQLQFGQRWSDSPESRAYQQIVRRSSEEIRSVQDRTQRRADRQGRQSSNSPGFSWSSGA